MARASHGHCESAHSRGSIASTTARHPIAGQQLYVDHRGNSRGQLPTVGRRLAVGGSTRCRVRPAPACGPPDGDLRSKFGRCSVQRRRPGECRQIPSVYAGCEIGDQRATNGEIVDPTIFLNHWGRFEPGQWAGPTSRRAGSRGHCYAVSLDRLSQLSADVGVEVVLGRRGAVTRLASQDAIENLDARRRADDIGSGGVVWVGRAHVEVQVVGLAAAGHRDVEVLPWSRPVRTVWQVSAVPP